VIERVLWSIIMQVEVEFLMDLFERGLREEMGSLLR
jgi:hypothetical protein